MPYKSKAQQRAMHAKAEEGEIDPEVVKEFDKATKKQKGGFAALPERVKKSENVYSEEDYAEKRKEMLLSMLRRYGSTIATGGAGYLAMNAGINSLMRPLSHLDQTTRTAPISEDFLLSASGGTPFTIGKVLPVKDRFQAAAAVGVSGKQVPSLRIPIQGPGAAFIAGHEAGHLRSPLLTNKKLRPAFFKHLTFAPWLQGNMMLTNFALGYLSDEDNKYRNVLPYMSAAIGLPRAGAEVEATIRSLRAIKRTYGWSGVKRNIPLALAQVLGYIGGEVVGPAYLSGKMFDSAQRLSQDIEVLDAFDEEHRQSQAQLP